MYADASGAIDEALKLVEGFELEIGQQASSSKAFVDPGWGGERSVERLWGDAWAEVRLVWTSGYSSADIKPRKLPLPLLRTPLTKRFLITRKLWLTSQITLRL